MAWIWVAAVWISLLILSVVIYKVVQKLARKSYAEHRGYVKASGMEYPEDVGAVEEPVEQPVKKIQKREESEEPQPEEAPPELPAIEAKPAKKKKEIQKNPLLEYIEEWKEPEAAPVAIEPVGKEKIKKPKKGKVISPAKYPECFGTDYKLEKCKKDCGVAEECIKAVEVLQRM